MLCDVCHKNMATVHLTEIVNDKVMELHVCQECTKAKADELKHHISIPEFLSSFNAQEKSKDEILKARCSFCGMKVEEFKKEGTLGCSQCYIDLKEYVIPLLKKIQSSSSHTGKVPFKFCEDLSVNRKIKNLKNQLSRAVKLEEYEEAALIRDQIREHETQLKKNKHV